MQTRFPSSRSLATLRAMKTNPDLVLASASPRRRELLSMLGHPFRVVIPSIDETARPGELPRAYAERLAHEKAYAVKEPGIVIAADTIVVIDNTILGKPANVADAQRMLAALSDRTHEVITGVCIRNAERSALFSVVTRVTFRALTSREIEAYVATGCPMDKAGGYAIQGQAAPMVRGIDGSYTNVVGLPLCELHESLATFLPPD